MKISNLIIRFFKNISLLVLIIFLMLAYFYLPPKVVTHFDISNIADGFVEKSTFFYSIGIGSIVFMMLVTLINSFLPSLPIQLFFIPQRDFWTQNAESIAAFRRVMKDWLDVLIILVNVFLCVAVGTLTQAHRSDVHLPESYTWLPWLGGAMLLCWIVYIPIRLRLKNTIY